MISRLLQFVLIQRIFVLALFAIMLALGARAWMALPIDAFPDISTTQVKVIIKASGMTAEEIEAQITHPVETELLGIPKQSILRSTTKYAITSITVDFEDGTDIYWARQQVDAKLSGVWPSLPPIAEGGMAPMSTPLSEMFMFTIENPNLSLMERKHLLDWQVRPALRTVAGVAEVNILGGYTKVYQVNPEMSKLAAYNLSLADLEQRLIDLNTNGSVGRIDTGADAIVLRTEGRFANIDDLKQAVVSYHQGQAISLAQVAQVSVASLTRYGGVTRDGHETTQALIVALKNSNTAEVVKGVEEKLAQVQHSLPEGTELNIFYNRKSLIDMAVATISDALFQAIAIVIVLLAIFLGNVRASIVVASVIPVTVLLTFLLMSESGITANLMSLGGIVIAIGMLVDASVVVVENTVTELSKNQALPRLHLIYRACRRVAVPVIAGTLIVIVVFAPLLTLTGLEGRLFSPVALTIVYAMICALIAAFTLLPVLASLLIRGKEVKTPSYIIVMQRSYQGLLDRVLHNGKVIVVVATLLLVVSAVIFTQLGKTFMPVLDEGDLIVQLEKSPTISLQESLDIDKQVEQALLAQIPEIKQIVARVGSDELGMDPMSLNESDVFLQLNPTDTWRFESKAELRDAIREVMQQFPGINYGFTQPIQMRVSEMLTGSTGMVTVKVFGEDIDTLSQVSGQIAGVVESIDGAADVQMTLIEGGDFVSIAPKPVQAAKYGLSVSELSKLIKLRITGRQVGEVIEGKVRTPIRFAELSEQGVAPVYSVASLSQLPLLTPSGDTVLLQDVASVRIVTGPAIIEREQGQRFAVVATNVEGRDLNGFVTELQQQVSEQVNLPNGYSLAYGGEFENQIRATNNLLTVIPAVLLIIIIVLFSLFRSMMLAGIIMLNVPFALMGGVFALYITGEYLSVPASVGFIALLGVAVLNGVVMLAHLEDLKVQALDLKERISEGAKDRLRPILMTATTAMFGLIPLAAATGPGAEIQKPLAIVVIGGLITSTFITLFLLPVIYQAWEQKKHD